MHVFSIRPLFYDDWDKLIPLTKKYLYSEVEKVFDEATTIRDSKAHKVQFRKR